MNSLLLATLISCLVTILWKTAPITILRGDNLPNLVKKWLDFIPVAVMAALTGPDIFFYNGKFDFSFSNLFLLVSIPTLLVAWKTSNYFVTIAVGIALVILARQFGFS